MQTYNNSNNTLICSLTHQLPVCRFWCTR